MGARALLPLPALFSPDGPSQPKVPGLHRHGTHGAGVAAASGVVPGAAPSADPRHQNECTSGPHLRAIIVVVGTVLFFVTRARCPQVSLIPFMMLCCGSSSALWCTPSEVIVSLGPVPVCFFRRRIPYRDIASVTVIHGRYRALAALARRALHFWQPLSFAYGLTLGKPLVSIAFVDWDGGAAKATRRCPSTQPLLISVDKADDIMEYIAFRQEHGPDALLPESFVTVANDTSVKWVVCDLLELLLSWHARNQALCDVCSLLFQPFNPTDQGTLRQGSQSSHARTA